jgi:hypothetical protein
VILDFEPVRMDEKLAIDVRGDVLKLNGKTLDFGPLPEGGTLPWAAIGCPWIGSDARREGGQVRVTVILPCGPDAPHERRFMATRHVSDDGPVKLPPYG